MPRYLDIDKAIEAIVYVAHRTPDLFHVVKVLYFADKTHLHDYGRLITGDRYIAMKDGPVPSGAYDLVKKVRGDGFAVLDAMPEEAFAVEDWTRIVPKREPNLEYLSESDIEALDQAIETYGRMPFRKLRRIAHRERPYKEATANNDIPLASIIQDLENAELLFEYLNS